MLSRPKSMVARVARVVATLSLGVAVAVSGSTSALAQNVPVVRDAEIEALVRDYARPIFKAAGLANDGIDIVLVNDQSFNAFVTGRRLFINTGALMEAETPNEIIGVIAHEAGHIAGGHQQKLRDQLERAKTMAIIATLLGAGAMVAGATTNSRGLAGAGVGVAAGGGEMAQRSILAYQRTEEMTADRSAITYLNATGQSGMGMLKTFQRFQTALSLSGAQVDPYRISHPMPRDRISNLEVLVKQSPYLDKVDAPALQLRHDMMRVKIAVYMEGQAAASRLMRKMQGSLAAQYGEAQSAYLFGNIATALVKTNALIKAQPGNAYFQELRGDILMKANKPKEAADAYAKAVSLDKARSGLLPVSLGQALMATGTPDALKKAVVQINNGLRRDKENSVGYRYLAQAYGELGDIPGAELATAEGHFYSGNYKDAKIFAMRAQQQLKRGEPRWIRAQDIINYKPSGKV
ncbi:MULTISPECIES: M48 family metalloprotease [unclassified Mesorhizobium]|uniref:M48 family metalloprotease n=1 Tax=unclassified Mesorhizobium TaxID=325217 RepID=UPI00112B00B3|nr:MULTISPECIES: M48 family metalloprotease [unclassified Mesorhizobium]TPI56195.1 M48 family metallopeptidase [Mesorhizobium sp. B3-1-1]TPJ70545.1 M48 family metallopeptidase [Mesorhizobium sp. B2-6-7]TPJ89262.1 M48 family metallopeptidase [Mesorhizobium sp. B2-6-3]TPK04343.1 M48 family metallopeptidase [Mesorhizobium sp. B2-5-10]TPK14783.1 M48 family metallopeptidase [Mesorhizobium sp. B2-5-11]